MRKLFVPLALLLLLTACAARVPYKLVPDYTRKGIQTIVVLPVTDKAGDARAAQMLRKKLVQDIYFKGYPKLSPEAVDLRLALLTPQNGAVSGNIDPHTVGLLTGAEAALYCTLETLKTSYLALFARMTVEADFALRSTTTGEVLWEAHYATKETCSDITRSRLKVKSCQLCEALLQEAVDKVLMTLPDRGEAVK